MRHRLAGHRDVSGGRESADRHPLGAARVVLLGLGFTVVIALTSSLGVATASAAPSADASPAAAAATNALPTCLPGQEPTTNSGAGTPAPLGNLQGLPEAMKSGGTFAGVPLDAGQVEMAATIVAVGKQMGITRRGIEIGIAVATEQSSLRPDAINKDWLGLFQQNPVTYTQFRRTEPGGAAWMFFDQLVKQVPGYDTDPRSNYAIGDVVQKTTTGELFAQYQAMATDLAGQLLDAVFLQQDDVTCAPAAAEQATTGSAFDPGNIITDAVFYNTAAMTADQIRVFLRAEGEGCTGAYCLKNLTLTTPSEPADQYCAAYQGGSNEDAAAVIAKVSTACGVNPQVMLVTLQKESGLLSRPDVSAASYDAAFGWHCPDSGPGGSANCDPAYAGFFNQAFGMAKQWSRYRVDPQMYNYHAGETVNILWNVAESGCGSAPVTIQNTATASLYDYTPYQPNAAALAAYPGVGDSCSAYGNRNFFYMFRKYFGSTGGGTSTSAVSAVLATGTAVTIPNNQYVSAALAGQRITAPNAAVAAGLAAGFSALGLPYVWGGGGSGAGPNNGCARGGGAYNSCGSTIGFDCSGLTAYVLGMAGYQTPGDSGSQRAGGTSISWSQALPGDIVGFPGHVAIYLGTFGGRPYILEASWVGTPIHIVPLTRTDFDDRVHRYWTGPAIGAPRVADFSAIVRGPSIGTFTGIFTGSVGSAAGSSSSGPRTYLPTIPRITPRPAPAPVPVQPAPVVQAPAPVAEPAPVIEPPAVQPPVVEPPAVQPPVVEPPVLQSTTQRPVPPTTMATAAPTESAAVTSTAVTSTAVTSTAVTSTAVTTTAVTPSATTTVAAPTTAATAATATTTTTSTGGTSTTATSTRAAVTGSTRATGTTRATAALVVPTTETPGSTTAAPGTAATVAGSPTVMPTVMQTLIQTSTAPSSTTAAPTPELPPTTLELLPTTPATQPPATELSATDPSGTGSSATDPSASESAGTSTVTGTTAAPKTATTTP